MDQRFRKSEHLKSRKLIEQLFKRGTSLKAYPLVGIYMPVDELPGLQVGFSVPKRKIKLAVNRNTIKRRIREAYRQNRNLYGLEDARGGALMFIYMPNAVTDYQLIEKGMRKILQQLTEIKVAE